MRDGGWVGGERETGKQRVREDTMLHMLPNNMIQKVYKMKNGHHENRETEIETDKLFDLNSPSSHKLNR